MHPGLVLALVLAVCLQATEAIAAATREPQAAAGHSVARR